MHLHPMFLAFGCGFGWFSAAWWLGIFLQAVGGAKDFRTWRYATGWALLGLMIFCLSVAFGLEIQ